MSGFVSSIKILDEINESRKVKETPLSFGNEFLDKSLGGLYGDDLVIATARTGGGKTELVTQIALSNALAGKRVHFFALEAYRGEIELRLKFKMLAQAFYTQSNFRSYRVQPNFQDWLYHKQDDILLKFEPEIDEEFKRTLKTLSVFYRDKEFDLNKFESYMHQVGETTDLIILDHLHYFDHGSENENSATKQIVKQIRDLTLFYRKPVVLVVHLRKQDKRVSGLVPDLEEIHGASEISKIATKIIATAPAKDQVSTSSHIFPTYFRVLKNRTDGSRCFFVGLCGFDAQKNSYSEAFRLGQLSYDGTTFTQVENHIYPQWAKYNV